MEELEISSEEMEDIDVEVPEKFCVTTSRLMENAGYRVAEFIEENFSGEKVTVFSGKGNNGGDGLVAARRLNSMGFDVQVVLASRDVEDLVKQELEFIEAMDIPVVEDPVPEGLAVDALFGFNLDGDPRPPFDALIEEINEFETVVSVDVPSGVNADTGDGKTPHVNSDYTVTLGFSFPGLGSAGELWLADIGIPGEVYSERGLEKREVFEGEEIVRLRQESRPR